MAITSSLYNSTLSATKITISVQVTEDYQMCGKVIDLLMIQLVVILMNII